MELITKMPHSNYMMMSDSADDAFKKLDSAINLLCTSISKIDLGKSIIAMSDETLALEKFANEVLLFKNKNAILIHQIDEYKEKIEELEDENKSSQIKFASLGVMPYNIFREISKGANISIDHDCFCRVCGLKPSEVSVASNPNKKEEIISLQPSENELHCIIKKLQEENTKYKTKIDQLSLQVQESQSIKINEEMIINSSAFRHLLTEGEALAKQYADLKQKLVDMEDHHKNEVKGIIASKDEEAKGLQHEINELREGQLKFLANLPKKEITVSQEIQIPKVEEQKYTEIIEALEKEKKSLSESLQKSENENVNLKHQLEASIRKNGMINKSKETMGIQTKEAQISLKKEESTLIIR